MISVVIPLYNKEFYIVETVKTVLDQTFGNFELLVVDDGSKDGGIAKLAAVKDERLKVLQKKNGGVSSARNYGIAHAQYDYVAFLDADDYWKPDFLEKIVMLIQKYPEAEVFATNFYYLKPDQTTGVVGKHDKEGIIDHYFKLALTTSIIHSSAVAIKKTAFEKVGYFHEKMSRGEDLHMWARLGKTCKIAYYPLPCTVYRLEAQNSSSSFVPHPEQSFAYYIDLNNVSSKEEKKYLKNTVIIRTLNYLRFARFDYFFLMIKKYKWGYFK